MTTSFGNYDDDVIDRDVEDTQIHKNTVNAPMELGKTGSMLDQFKARVQKKDKNRYRVFPVATVGEPIWLELDMDFDEEDFKRIRVISDEGNREQRRADKPRVGTKSMHQSVARIINDKTTSIYFEDPENGGQKLCNDDGQIVTFLDPEIRESITGHADTDPELVIQELIPFMAALVFHGLVSEALDERANPTRG